MKIFISMDAEGCSGLTRFPEVLPDSLEYSRGTKAMMNDLKTVISTVRAELPDSFITVNDGHEEGGNLSLDDFGADEVVRGTGAPFSMMQGIENGFDIAMYVGYHSMAGTDGIMCHTYFPGSVKRVEFDGEPVGEFGINAALAEYFGCKSIFISGDDDVCLYESGRYDWLGTGIVKKVVSPMCAVCFCNTEEILKSAVKNALSRAENSGKINIPKFIRAEFFDGTSWENETKDYSKAFVEMIDIMRKKDTEYLHIKEEGNRIFGMNI